MKFCAQRPEVITSSLLAWFQMPLKDIHWANVHADAVSYTSLPVHSDLGSMYPQPSGVRLALGVKSLFPLSPHLMPFMLTCNWIFFGLAEELGIDRLRLIIDLPCQKRRLLSLGQWLKLKP
jgi:hypothetical protein